MSYKDLTYREPEIPPCDVCHRDPGRDCNCPECQECGESGNPTCYVEHTHETFMEWLGEDAVKMARRGGPVGPGFEPWCLRDKDGNSLVHRLRRTIIPNGEKDAYGIVGLSIRWETYNENGGKTNQRHTHYNQDTFPWKCPTCEVQNPGKNLFCKTKKPDGRHCEGHHPHYWERTANWPIRKQRPSFYIT